jgi:5'-nucleotidase
LKRREFLSSAAGFGVSLLAPRFLSGRQGFVPHLARPRDEVLITVLHTNDTHSQIEPLPANDKTYPGKGGIARRATLVKRVRQQNPNTLLIDAGDVFQGTPYFNFYKGEVEYRAMSMIGYDAGTIGNHEFDNGVEALATAMQFAKFALVSSNYDVQGTALEKYLKRYIVREIAGVRIGLFGLGISPVGLITPANFKGVTYQDPITVAREVVRELRQKEHCVMVLCMSHLGYYSVPKVGEIGDSQLAAQVDGIDFIASGHTHTFMREPVRVVQPSGAETLIFQVGKSGIYVGRVDFTLRAGRVMTAVGRLLDLRLESVS